MAASGFPVRNRTTVEGAYVVIIAVHRVSLASEESIACLWVAEVRVVAGNGGVIAGTVNGIAEVVGAHASVITVLRCGLALKSRIVAGRRMAQIGVCARSTSAIKAICSNTNVLAIAGRVYTEVGSAGITVITILGDEVASSLILGAAVGVALVGTGSANSVHVSVYIAAISRGIHTRIYGANVSVVARFVCVRATSAGCATVDGAASVVIALGVFHTCSVNTVATRIIKSASDGSVLATIRSDTNISSACQVVIASNKVVYASAHSNVATV